MITSPAFRPPTTWLPTASALLVSAALLGCAGSPRATPVAQTGPSGAPAAAAGVDGGTSEPIEAETVRTPSARAISPDILLVDDEVLTTAETLYPIRHRVAELRQRGATAEDPALRRLIQRQVQQELGTILLYRDATRDFGDRQHQVIDSYVEDEVQGRVMRSFDGSLARFERHLADNDLTLNQYRQLIRRRAVAQNYANERFLPQVHVRRAELVEYYESRLDEFSEPATRELRLITIPYESVLEGAADWASATDDQRATARAVARARIQAAYAALQNREFADVAREFSIGPMAGQGGNWGAIGRPLQAPYDEPSEKLFELPAGGYSEPLESEFGCFIVGCGAVEAGHQPTFAELQDRLRAEYNRDRINALTEAHMTKLAREASISSLEAFVRAAVKRAAARPPGDESPGR